MKQSAAASEAHNHLTRFVTTPKKDLEKVIFSYCYHASVIIRPFCEEQFQFQIK